MLRRSERIRFGWLAALSLGASALLGTAPAKAQAQPQNEPEPSAPPAAAAPAEAVPTETAPPPEPPQPETAQAPTQSATPLPGPTPAAAPPPGEPPASLIPDGEAPKGPIAPAFPPAIPNLDYGARLRAAIKLQNVEDPEKIDDVGEQLEADLYVNGQVHRYLKFQVALTLAYPGTAAAPGAAPTAQQVNVTPLDVIARFEPLPEFNVYLGRMLVVVDRFAPSGPWGIDEFFFPGFFPLIGPPALPKAGPVGRDVGATIWGAPLKGLLKYYLGAFNLYDPSLNPLLSARIQASFLNGEPAFYHRGTYFGTKDIISVGVGGQYQKDGSVQPVPVTTPPTVPLTDDYDMVTADLTIEKNIGDAGTLSAVGAFSKFSGDYQRWENFWLASLGYMLPQPIGIGKPRVTVRYQRALDAADGADASSVLDAQLSYNVAAWFARFALGYRRGESWLPPSMTAPAALAKSNMLYLGVTLADP
jgi:hypothetical protein